jgi:hypothetical protein
MQPVVCTATDSRGQTGNCTLDVTVNAVPVIAKTNFMAFGDSMTEGTTSPAPMLLTTNPSDAYPSSCRRCWPSVISIRRS